MAVNMGIPFMAQLLVAVIATKAAKHA